VQTRRRDIFTTVHTEGALLPADLLQRIAKGDRQLDGLLPETYHLAANDRIGDAVARAWNRLVTAWIGFKDAVATLPERDTATSLTREQWLLVVFRELGYGRLQAARAVELDRRSYAVSHNWGAVPIHLVGARVPLDRRTSGVAGAATQSPHGLVQELLNRSETRLWGLVSNGLVLRVLRDNSSLTRQAYVEFDLEAMMSGGLYSDFVVFWLVCHQSRLDGESPERCWLERWSQHAAERGTRALETLRAGVESAIATLGRGFIEHPANRPLRDALRHGALGTDDYYRQLLRVVYRLLFLFVAEDRDLLLGPDASPAVRARYARFFGTQRLRRLAARRRGGTHVDLYEALLLVMSKLGDDNGCSELGLPPLGGFLWSETAAPNITSAQLANRNLLDAVRAVAFIEAQGIRQPVDYKNLGSEELGSVYESLLELRPEVDIEARTFALGTAPGHERKTSGSYYTPASLIKVVLDSALEPLLHEAERQEDVERAILAITVCDPACGSGHFLVAAAHRIARHLARARTRDEEPSPEATRRALRDIVGRSLYGVDVNPMAVELCKVALWMETLEPGRPLSFLDGHIKSGNSLLGATPELIAAGIPDEAFKPLQGDDRSVAQALRRRNRDERIGQLTLEDLADLSVAHTSAASAVDGEMEDSIGALKSKARRYGDLVTSTEYMRSKQLADTWAAAFVAPKRAGTPHITGETLRRIVDGGISADLSANVERLASKHHFFHWHVEFSTIFGGLARGFDLVLGNPPFVNAIEGSVDPQLKRLLRFVHRQVGGTADLAYYFLSAARVLVRPGGRVALIQPRAVLNAPSAQALRGAMVDNLRPNLLYAPDRSDLFAGPAVFVAIVVLGPNEQCRVSKGKDPVAAEWAQGRIRGDNWWSVMDGSFTGETEEPVTPRLTIGDTFVVVASMTTADAYDVVPWVLDEREGSHPKLVTTGLIEPGYCLWGSAKCRYLKRDLHYPRIDRSGGLTKSLRRRTELSTRPKLLVAGLSKCIECFLDGNGEYIGAVSTYSIFHPDDDVASLEALCAELLSEAASLRFVNELGGNAMGGGSITMKKSFLALFPYPSPHKE